MWLDFALLPCRCAMRVYLDENGDKRLVGRADVPDDCGPIFEVPVFGSASIVLERFMVGAVTRMPFGNELIVERAVILWPGQLAEALPGWMPLAA